MIRAYNATRETKGQFETLEEAYNWAKDNLPQYNKYYTFEMLKKDFDEDSRVMLGEGNPEACYSEDVVIFNDEIHEPDEDGYIDW